jgi:hypothetical protein
MQSNHTSKTSRECQLISKIESKNLFGIAIPHPLFLGYSSFETKLYTAQNTSTCLAKEHSSNTGATTWPGGVPNVHDLKTSIEKKTINDNQRLKD